MEIQEYIESGIIESYVLGIAEPAEIAEVEKLKLQYIEIQKAIDVFSITLEQMALKNAVPPPADIKPRLMAELDFNTSSKDTFPLTVAYNSNDKSNEEGSIKKMRTWRFAAAASIILFLASAAANFFIYNKYSKKNSELQALLIQTNSLQASNQVFQTKVKEFETANQMMADPEYQKVNLLDPNKKKDYLITAFWSRNTKDVFISVKKLPQPTPGKQYQLWALVDGNPVDAGMLDPTCKSLCKMKNIPRAQAFAVTLEVSGGSPEPTMEQLFVMGKI